MISFLFKSKPLVIDCFTTIERIAETYPITRAFKHVPKWWRTLNPSFEVEHPLTKLPLEHPTMKTCSGFVNLYKKGYIMPLWTDVDFFITKEKYSYMSAEDKFSVISHDSREYGNTFNDYYHMKLESQWYIREKSGVDFLFNPCIWSEAAYFPYIKVLPAVVEYKNQHTTNINWFVSKNNINFRLESGTPLVQIIPLTERKTKICTHVITRDEWDKLRYRMHRHKFKGGYLKVLKQAKNCPYTGDAND